MLRILRTLAAVTLASGGLVSMGLSAAPAYADQPGLFCTIASRGTLSATPSNVVYGDPVNVHWDLKLIDCPAPVWWIEGPGFGGDIPTAGDRQVPAISDLNTITWSLYLEDFEVDAPRPELMASATVVVH
jgi:hypothetical protein